MTPSGNVKRAPTDEHDPIHAISRAGDCKTTESEELGSTVYSVFTKAQKRWVIFLAAFAGWFSTLSSFIFFLAITALADDIYTTIESVNLRVTSYLIVRDSLHRWLEKQRKTSAGGPYILLLSSYI